MAKTLNKAGDTLKGCTERTVAWGDTTDSSVLLAFAQMESQADAQWADALVEYGAARAAYADVWAEVLEKERARDSARKALARAESNLESAQSKINKAQGKSNYEQKRAQLEGGLAEAQTELATSREEAERLTEECETYTAQQLVAATKANAAASLKLCALGTRVYTDLEARCGELVGGGGAKTYARSAVSSAASSLGLGSSSQGDEDTAAMHATTASGAGMNPFDSPFAEDGGDQAGAAQGAGESDPFAEDAGPSPAGSGNPFGDEGGADDGGAGNPFGDSEPAAEPATIAASAGGGADDGAVRVRAIASFEGGDDGELAFEEGDILYVTDMTGDWYYGRNEAGIYGDIPSNFVETA